MKSLAVTSWQRCRTSINHDWLKNHFLTGLDAVQNVLNGRVKGEAYLTYVLKEIVTDWDLRKGEVAELVQGFEEGMSPKLLLDRAPLVYADIETVQHCQKVVHQLWLGRCDVPQLVESALQALREADTACTDLKPMIPEAIEADDRLVLATIFAEFRNRCRSLVKSLEAFPSEIRAF